MRSDGIKIGCISPWFGAKRNMASNIISAIGKHSSYWEPFCGSLAILLSKPVVSMETVNDLHGDIINLARVVAKETTAVDLYGRLNRTLMHEDIFHESADRFKDRGHVAAGETDVARAYDFFVASWFGRNGVAGTQSYNQGFCVRYTNKGGHAAIRFVNAVESIPGWHLRLRHVTILNRDAFEIIPRIEDAEGTVVYVDPPYLVKGSKYVYDFAAEDHQRLADLLCRFRRTRIIISYYADERLAALYPGWKKTRFDMVKALVHQGMRGKEDVDVKAPEVLLTNDRNIEMELFA